MFRTLKLSLLGFISLIGVALAAPLVIEAEDLRITLSETEKCTDSKVTDRLNSEYLELFYSAEVIFKGEKFSACWAVTPRGKIFVIDETGDYGEADPLLLSRGKEV